MVHKLGSGHAYYLGFDDKENERGLCYRIAIPTITLYSYDFNFAKLDGWSKVILLGEYTDIFEKLCQGLGWEFDYGWDLVPINDRKLNSDLFADKKSFYAAELIDVKRLLRLKEWLYLYFTDIEEGLDCRVGNQIFTPGQYECSDRRQMRETFRAWLVGLMKMVLSEEECAERVTSFSDISMDKHG